MTHYQVTAEGPGSLRLNQRVKVRGTKKGGATWGRVVWVSEDGRSGNVDVDDRPRRARRADRSENLKLARKKEKQSVARPE